MRLAALAVSGRGLVDPAEPVFRADDEAVLRGGVAFETIRVAGGTAFLFDEHVERLRFSARELGLDPPAEAAELAALVLAAGPADGVLRLYRAERVEVASLAELPPGLDEQRARGITLSAFDVGATTLLEGVKSTSYAVSFAARRAAEARGFDDALLLDGEQVLETATANIFWRNGERVCTPSVASGVLPGVTRAFVLRLLQVEEGAFDLRELHAADEAFTTSSIREVMPVVSVDGQPIGEGKPGPTAARLQAALRLPSEG
jgi:4-amino-4-deoxychorismate lyase